MDLATKQVGGEHYKSKYPPIKLIAKLQLNFFQGNILKYPSRFTKKNGEEDLRKAISYCQLGAELSPVNVAQFSQIETRKYVKENNLPDDFVEFVEQICNQNWIFCSSYIVRLSRKTYG